MPLIGTTSSDDTIPSLRHWTYCKTMVEVQMMMVAAADALACESVVQPDMLVGLEHRIHNWKSKI